MYAGCKVHEELEGTAGGPLGDAMVADGAEDEGDEDAVGGGDEEGDVGGEKAGEEAGCWEDEGEEVKD